jgi:hypothetical protein
MDGARLNWSWRALGGGVNAGLGSRKRQTVQGQDETEEDRQHHQDQPTP